MKRRQFLKTSIAASAVLAAPEILCGGRSKDDRPNILFIMTDQQSAHMMSCTGNTYLETPNLDALCASGTRFERCYATNPVCVPSRFSLQTGLMPSAIGMGKNQSSVDVPEDMQSNSLGPLLRRAGYECAYGGKVHLPGRLAGSIMQNGYDLIEKDSRDLLAESCAKFLKQPHKKPFFLFASFINPHDICYLALNDYARKADPSSMKNNEAWQLCEKILREARVYDDLGAFVEENCPPLPDNFQVQESEPQCITTHYLDERPFRRFARENWSGDMWRLHRWLYCRLTERVDRQIGRVLNALRESGQADNTLVIFTSDHGDHDSAHHLEHKSILYEEAARIPFVMAMPGKIPAGRVDETHLVSNGLDLLPTLCDYAGISAPKGLPGRSVRPIAEQTSGGDWRKSIVVESQNGRMVRTERFKYCVYDCGKNRETLVDLKNDPGETKNLAASSKYKKQLNTHRSILANWMKKTTDPMAKSYLID